MAAEQKQAFTGRHVLNVKLTGSGSAKDTRHHEIAIEAPAAEYLPGDALGALAPNSPALVDRILAAIGATGDEVVNGPDGAPAPIGRLLSDIYNLTTPSRRLFELMAGRGATEFMALLDRTNAEQFKHHVGGWNNAHDVLDVLDGYPRIRLTPAELAETLRKNLPRLYSIASSLKAHPGQVHLLVVSVQFEIRGRCRQGLCSTWLADRWPIGAAANLYLQNQQKHFALPSNGSTPVIMIGPGTGLAPFRAFIEERRALGATGKNWLFFGEQRRATDFFYEAELTGFTRDRFLRLDAAFSRDQAEKVYVQHKMRESARDLWAWLEEGAEFFVCGDKERMAADVERELLSIIETEGARPADQAREYLENLRRTKRYKRDVY